MSGFRVSRDIIPIGEFKAQASRVVRELKDESPVVITQNGRAAAVVLTPEEYDRLTYHDFVRAKIEAGLAQAERGETVTTEQLVSELEEEFGPLGL